jgi:hypothetical protein
MVGLLVIVAALGGEPRATAQAPDPEALVQARSHHDRGVTEYNLGRFDSAIREFERAYELDPDPILLFNLAQAHRRAGHDARAVFTYKRYLDMDPGARYADEARQRIAELGARRPSPPPPPPPPLPARPVPVAAGVQRGGVELSIGAGPAVPSYGSRDIPQPLLLAAQAGVFYRPSRWRGVASAGVLFPYARLPYRSTLGVERSSHLLGALAAARVSLAVSGRWAVGGALAAGVVWWGGIGPQNPFALDGASADGPVPLPALRLAVGLRARLGPDAFVVLSPVYLWCKTRTGLADAFSHLGVAALVMEVGYDLRGRVSAAGPAWPR